MAAERQWNLALVCGFGRALVSYALRVARRRVVAFRQRDDKLDIRLYRALVRPARFHIRPNACSS